MLVSNLACETKVEKGVCLRRLAKFSLHSKRFQSNYCAKVVAKANLKWNGEGEGRRGNACPQTQWSFPSLPSSSLLTTIFGSRPDFLDELARKRLLRRLKFRTRKFRPGIACIISTNKLHLPKNRREGLKLGCLIYIYKNHPGGNLLRKHKTLKFDVVSGEKDPLSTKYTQTAYSLN